MSEQERVEQITSILDQVLKIGMGNEEKIRECIDMSAVEIVTVSSHVVNQILGAIQGGAIPGVKYLDKQGIEALFMMGMMLGAKYEREFSKEKTT